MTGQGSSDEGQGRRTAAFVDDPDERALLEAVVADPDDDGPRLVYADWLEERGDVRAEWLRAEVAVHGSEPGPEQNHARGRLGNLVPDVPLKWRLIVSRVPVMNCDRGAGSRQICGLRWAELDPPSKPDSKVRRCSDCGSRVLFTRNAVVHSPFCLDEVVSDRPTDAGLYQWLPYRRRLGRGR